MKQRSLLCILLVFTYSCTQNSLHEKGKARGSDTVLEAVGIVMNADTIKPAKVLAAGTPKTIKAGAPIVKEIEPNFGEAGGLSMMQNYTTDNGLALDAISLGHKSALCDRNGNIWFGTNGGGASRYDGKSFTHFSTAQGLPHNVVLSITEDKSGNIWFGTDGGGASRYDGKSFTHFSTAQGLAHNVIHSITEDKNGNIWFGTEGGGVSRYDGKSFTNFSTAQGLTDNFVYSITENKNGNIWFGTDGGVSRYDGKSFTHFSTAEGLAHNVVLSITEDKSGNPWFGTYGGGVSRYDGKSFTNFTSAQGLASNDVRSIAEDKSGNLWFGTYGGGVSRYDGKSFTNFTTAQGLAHNVVCSITEDKSGNIWFGTQGGGVSRYDGKSFTNFSTAQGLAHNVVYSITEDKTGNLWFGTSGGGVSRYDGNGVDDIVNGTNLYQHTQQDLKKNKKNLIKSFTNFSTAQGLPNNIVYSITEDKSGNLWFGTSGGGASRYDGKSFTNFTTAQGLAHNIVYSITEDKSGNLWFGTLGGGASRYDGKSFTHFTTAQGLAHNFVFSITEDKNGNIWFGTDGGGVSRYDGKFFTNFTTEQGLAYNFVYNITEDKSGNLWFGTAGGGVSRYDGKSFINFTTAQGLPDNTVTQVVLSKEQNIVMGTNFGVAVVDSFISKLEINNKKNKIPAANSLSNQELKNYEPVIEIYNTATGYPIKDVNSGQGAMYCDSKGIIWVATGSDKTGLVRFDYKALNKNPNPPKVIIQSIKINEENVCWYNLDGVKNDSATKAQQEVQTFGKPLSTQERDSLRARFGEIKFDGISKFYPLPENLVLPYKNNHIRFEFAAIEPARPYLVKYQYLLEGYDEEWSPLTNKTDVSFGNIYEGTYTFKLKARSPFGIWSEPITYTFKVLPPWWRTWWMYAVYGIIAVGLISAIVWYNGKKLRARAKELKTKVDEATIEIKEQKRLIEERHKEITDSINYAERIQRSLLASKKTLDESLKDYFVLFKPKDVVSGDFYWAANLVGSSGVENFLLCVADSTGHGVPGAIMSILNIACLKEASLQGITSPDLFLNKTRSLIIENLKNDGSAEGGKDGMDGSLLSFDFKNNILYCACANNPVWIIREGILIEIKADRFPIGKYDRDKEPFTLHTIKLQKGDVVYTLTDGFPDQFGGPSGKKFKYKKLQELLLSIAGDPMPIQKQKLHEAFESWKGNLEQVDDVTIVGARI
ncbi:MAG: SpoIIE family protein phosphatase [Bacteroidetes bacterium]|nr:SpoIIE family protein phosphatase [Bacteroidota bacterium]